MTTFIIVFIILILAGTAMSIGVIFGRVPIKGSCGGLGAVGVERACGCKDTCANGIKSAHQAEKGAEAVRYRP